MGEDAIYGASLLEALMANVNANTTAAQALQATAAADSPSTNAGEEDVECAGEAGVEAVWERGERLYAKE